MYYLDKDRCYLSIFNGYGRIPWGLYDDSDGRRLVTGDHNAIFSKPGILMEFTGLYDESTPKQELWEDDIIKRNGHHYRIVFNQELGGWCIDRLRQPFDAVVSLHNGTYLVNFLSGAVRVGNIHQHPELIRSQRPDVAADTNL